MQKKTLIIVGAVILVLSIAINVFAVASGKLFDKEAPNYNESGKNEGTTTDDEEIKDNDSNVGSGANTGNSNNSGNNSTGTTNCPTVSNPKNAVFNSGKISDKSSSWTGFTNIASDDFITVKMKDAGGASIVIGNFGLASQYNITIALDKEYNINGISEKIIDSKIILNNGQSIINPIIALLTESGNVYTVKTDNAFKNGNFAAVKTNITNAQRLGKISITQSNGSTFYSLYAITQDGTTHIIK